MRLPSRPALLAAAVAAALAVGPAPPAAADAVTLDFSALAPDAGTVIDQVPVRVGDYTIYVYSSRVIGPGDPDYAGRIGLLPTGDDPAGNALDILSPGYRYESSPRYTGISADFAPSTAGGSLVWYGDNFGPGNDYWFWAWGGTAAGVTTEAAAYTAGAYAAEPTLLMKAGAGDEAQILSVTLDFLPDAPPPPPPPAAPEPPAGALAAAALACLAAARVSRRCGRTCGR